MSAILLITSEMAGRINLTCELAARLTAAGHETAVACPADVSERVAALGVRYVPIGTPSESVPATTPPPAPASSLLRRIGGFVRRAADVRAVEGRRRAKADGMGLETFADVLIRETPDLVLIDVELPAHVMAAHGAGARILLWTSMLSLWKRPGLPPLGSSIVVGRGLAGSSLGIEAAWLRFRAWKWARRTRHRITRAGEDQLSVLRTIAADHGFPFSAEVDVNQWLLPFTFRSLPTVSFNARELEFPHEPPANCTYAGPVLPRDGNRAHPTTDHASERSRLDELFARRAREESAALVYCSFGAWHKGDDRAFLHRILEGVATRPEWDVVVGLGGRIEPHDLGDVPGNVHLFEWAPQLEILGHADAAIHHGGISSVNECITRGVPMVCYPFDFMDQPGNAARVSYHGIGERGDRAGDAPGEITDRINRLLTDPAIRANVERMQRAVLRYEEEDRAVSVVEAMLEVASR